MKSNIQCYSNSAVLITPFLRTFLVPPPVLVSVTTQLLHYHLHHFRNVGVNVESSIIIKVSHCPHMQLDLLLLFLTLLHVTLM